MPSRIVDGDSLWRSKKLKNVPVEFRAEYANLIPLAEANGCFDADVERVWADVYSYNRPDFPVERVVNMLAAFVDAGMIERWEQDGKVWGKFVCIDKPGRLPSEAHLVRYKNLPPTPPVPDSPGPVPEGLVLDRIGEGLGMERQVAQKQLNAFKLIPNLCRELTGLSPEPENFYKKDLKAAAEAYGGTKVVEAFESWARARDFPDGTRNPIRNFLQRISHFVDNQVRPVNPALEALCLSLYHIGGSSPNARARGSLNLLLEEFSFQEIEAGYKEYIQPFDDYQMKFAIKDFCEAAGRTVILAARQRNKELEKQAEYMAAEEIRQREEVEKEITTEVVETEL